MGQIIFLILLTILILSIRYLYRLASAPGIFATIIFSLIGALMTAKGLERIVYHYNINHHFQAAACKVEKQIPDEVNRVAAPQDATVYTFSIGDKKSTLDFLCPSVLYSYTMNNQTYQKSFQLSCATDEAGQKRILSGYPEGGTVACFINPDNYGDVVFSREPASLFWYFFISFGVLMFSYVNYRFMNPLQKANESLLSQLAKSGSEISSTLNEINLKRDMTRTASKPDSLSKSNVGSELHTNQRNPVSENKPTKARDVIFMGVITAVFFRFDLLHGQARSTSKLLFFKSNLSHYR